MKALSFDNFEKILEGVLKPGRYIGNEFAVKSKSIINAHDAKVFFALVFPDLYEVGMSNLGMQILYEIINSRDDFSAERVFSPGGDLEANLRNSGTKIFSLENRVFLDEFDMIGFSLQHELQYTNALNIIDLAGLSLRSEDRQGLKPIICAGGPAVINPLPMAPFIDFFVIGDGEKIILDILDLAKRFKLEKRSKQWFLGKVKKFEGIFVPSEYKFFYFKNGKIKKIEPDIKVKKTTIKDLNDIKITTNPVISNIKPVHDRFVCEIMRGCFRGCRFCQAGYTYRPVRMRKPENLICDCIEGVNKSGYDEVSFLSLSSSDYKDLDLLITGFINLKGDKKISVSLPSLRFDSFTLNIAETVQSGRKTGLTFAPEAGTQIMRNIINKNINEEEMLECIKIAFEKGWEKVKLYFMIGLPFENEEDIEAIPDLVHKIIGTAKAVLPKNKIGRLNINLSINAFSPKPFTPFQWAGQDSTERLNQKFLRIRQKLPKKFVTISWSDPERSKLECALARGDLKIADVIEEAFKNGAKFDNWSEFFDFKIWQNAFSRKDIDIEYLTEREADIHEVLPWDFIDIPTSKEFLIKEFDNAKSIALNNGRRS